MTQIPCFKKNMQPVRVVRSTSTIVATLPNFQGEATNGLSRFYCNGWWLQATGYMLPPQKKLQGKVYWSPVDATFVWSTLDKHIK